MLFTLRYLFLATAVLCIELRPRPQSFEESRFHFRRAVDGSRGRKYFDPDEDGSYDRYRHLEDHYDGTMVKSGFEDIRGNVPGEPGADYPVYTRVPETRFSCENRAQGYYADEETGCQAFHVCSNVVVSSFICPVGSIFSQKLLTCDWWNKVDCATTESYYTMRQGSFRDTNEMVRKAFIMMQLPKPNVIKSDPQIEASSPPNRVNIGFRGNERTKFDVRGAFGTLRDRDVPKYNQFHTKQTGVFEDFRFGGKVNENTLPTQNVVNVNYLRPENYESNLEGFGSRLNNNRAKDSPIVFLQRNPNDNVRESYSTLRPFTFGNSFQSSRQLQQNDFRNPFQPSYAPTVPTVTSTTRRLYSPTVPTTQRPSTTSYDQDPEVYLLQQEANRQSDQDYGTAGYTDNGQDRGNVAEIIQPQESIGIVQSYGERLIKSGNSNTASFESDPRNAGAQFGTGSDGPGHQGGYRHFYSNQVTVDSRLRRQETGGVGGVSADNFREAKMMENPKNVLNLRQNIPPLIVQIPRPEGEPGKPATDIGDQLFTYDSFIKMSPVMPETPPPVRSSTSDSEGVSIRITPPVSSTDDEDVFPPPRKRPPMISDIPQSIGTLGLILPGVVDNTFESPKTTQPPASSEESTFGVMDENATTVPPRTTPVISQIPGSVGASGVNIPDGNFTISSFTPPLILQPSQNDTRSASQPSSMVGDETTFDASSGPDETQVSTSTDLMQTDENGATVPPGTTPIISQIPGSVGASGVNISDTPGRNFTSESPLMPPLIVQSPQNATPPDPQPSSMVDDTSSFDAPPRIIPPLISGDAQPNGTQSPIFTDDPDSIQSFESSSRIPPLIPQTSRPPPPPPPFSDTSTRIPLLIPSIPQSTDTPPISSPSGDDGTNTLESSSRIPPLLPPIPRPLPPSFSGTIDDDDTSTKIPLLIPPMPQSTDTPAISPPSGDDGTNTLESSSRRPPLLPPIPRPLPPSSSGTIDDDDTSTRIPLLIPPIPQSTDTPAISPPSGDDGINTLESSSRRPPLHPPIPRPLPPSLSGTIDDDDTSTRIPLLIPPIPQSIDTPAISSPNDNDGRNTLESSSRIPPLIPQPSRPPPPSFSDTIEDGDTTTRIPLLIPSIRPTDKPVTSPPDANDETNTFESSSRIPPLIPQPSRPPPPSFSDTSTRIPLLIPSIPQSTDTPAISPPNGSDGAEPSESSSRIPPLIPQSTTPSTPLFQPIDSLAINSPDPTYPFELPSRIPPLLPPAPRPPQPSVSLGTVNDDDVRIPPLIPQIPQSTDTPATDRPEIDPDRIYPFESPSRIPPLIPQTAQPSTPLATNNGGNTQTEIPPLIPETPSFGVNDEKKTLDSSPSVQQVPPLIDQTSDTLGTPDSSYPFESPLSIPPLIPQTLRPAVSSTSKPMWTFESSTNTRPSIVQTMIDDGDTSSIVPKIDPVIPLIPESSGPKSPSPNVGETHGPTTIAPVIPQILEYIGRPGVKPTNIFYQSKTSYDSRPPPTLGTNIDSGNPPSSWVSSTTEQTFFSYTGPYQPLPSGNFPTSTMRQPPDQSYSVVTSPTVNIPANVPESSTISPTLHVENPGYGMDVPDCGPTGTCYSSTPRTVTSRYDHSSDVGSLKSIAEPAGAGGQISEGISYFPIDDSKQSSLTHNIAVSLLPPKIDSRYINSIRHVNVASQSLTNEETSTLASPDKQNNLFEQSLITPSPDGGELPSQQASGSEDLRFTIRGGLEHTTPTPFAPFSGISSTLRTESSSTPRQSVFISDNSDVDFAQPKLYYPENVAQNNNQESSTTSSNEGANVTPTEPTFKGISYSQGPFESSSTPTPSSTASVTESRVSQDPSRDAYLQSTIRSGGLPPGFPAGFSQIEASLNNDNSPYQVTVTLNGDEDFNPTAEFISKLFAQQNGNGQLGLGDLAGYEIVRSEDSALEPATSDIVPSQAPTLSTLLDSRVNLGGPESAQQYYIVNQNPGTSLTTTRETRPPRMESPKPDNSFSGDGQDAAVQQRLNLESFDLPTKNATQWASDLRHEELRNRANLSIQKAKDINSSFDSLFKSVPKKAESPLLVKEHILEQLTKNFGHPLFNYGGSQINSFRPEASRSIDYADKQQFADLEKYRVPKKEVVKESQESTSPAPPETPTTTTTTTSTTSESPVRTFVETEFLPALSFSFDSDTGRQEYVEAVLKGLLSDNQPVDPWADFTASYRDSRANEKSKNATTEMQRA